MHTRFLSLRLPSTRTFVSACAPQPKPSTTTTGFFALT